jgi:hypothetical protein
MGCECWNRTTSAAKQYFVSLLEKIFTLSWPVAAAGLAVPGFRLQLPPSKGGAKSPAGHDWLFYTALFESVIAGLDPAIHPPH